MTLLGTEREREIDRERERGREEEEEEEDVNKYCIKHAVHERPASWDGGWERGEGVDIYIYKIERGRERER